MPLSLTCLRLRPLRLMAWATTLCVARFSLPSLNAAWTIAFFLLPEYNTHT
jgi:hypothetical protein